MCLPRPPRLLRPPQVAAAAKAALGARAFRARCKFLERETEVLDPEEEPFEVS